MTARLKRIIAAAATAIALGVGALVAVQDAAVSEGGPLSCTEAQLVARGLPEATRAERMAIVRDACDRGRGVTSFTSSKLGPGQYCRDGLLYGPGLGGVDASGNLVPCPITYEEGVDVWLPPVVRMGVKPEDVASGVAFEKEER